VIDLSIWFWKADAGAWKELGSRVWLFIQLIRSLAKKYFNYVQILLVWRMAYSGCSCIWRYYRFGLLTAIQRWLSLIPASAQHDSLSWRRFTFKSGESHYTYRSCVQQFKQMALAAKARCRVLPQLSLMTVLDARRVKRPLYADGRLSLLM